MSTKGMAVYLFLVGLIQFPSRHFKFTKCAPVYWTICHILPTFFKGNCFSLSKICISKKTRFLPLLRVSFNPFSVHF